MEVENPANIMEVVSGPVSFVWGGKEYTYSKGTVEILDKHKKARESAKEAYLKAVKRADKVLTERLEEIYGSD